MFRFIVSRISLIVTIIFAILLVLSDISVLIKPAYLWFFPFLGLLFPYLVIANIVFVIIWGFKKRIAIFIPLIVLIFSFPNLRSSFQFSLQHTNNTRTKKNLTIKVLSYNVRLFNRFEQEKNYNQSRQRIVKYLEKEKPDIICLQEFFAEKGSIAKSGYLSQFNNKKNHYAYYTAKIYNDYYGVVTLSRYPIIRSKVISFENSDNISIYCDIVIEKDTVRVFNTHLQSIKFIKRNYDFIDSFKLEYNNKQMSEIKDISKKLKKAFIMRSKQVERVSEIIKNTRYQTIVCGDFNDTPVSYTYRNMSDGLKDAFIESGNGIGNTYNGVFPSYRIDYILHSSKFKAIKFNTGNIDASDHYPVTAVLLKIK